MPDTIMPLRGETSPLPPYPAPGPLDAIQRALENGALPETLEKMMALQERYEATQALAAFNSAFAAARAEIEPIAKSNPVDFTNERGKRTNYKYESLADVARVVDPILARHGLSYRFSAKTEGMFTEITCHLFHVRGHSEEASLPGGLDTSGSKNPMQALGSSVSYLKRYTLGLVLGLASEKDDDAQSAPGNGGDKGDKGDKAPLTIDAEQYRNLVDLIEKAGKTQEEVMDLWGCKDLHTITQSQFGEARSALVRKIAKQKQAMEEAPE